MRHTHKTGLFEISRNFTAYQFPKKWIFSKSRVSENRLLQSKNVSEKVDFLGPKKEATFQILQFFNG